MFTQFNKTKNTDRLQLFVTQTKKNGYFNRLKQINKSNSPTAQTDTFYRKKAEAHYAKKIKKPFRLFEQPEYQRQKQFFSNFNDFINSIPQFEKIQESRDNSRAKNAKSKFRQMYSQTLVYDPFKKSEFSPENIEKRKNRTIQPDEVNEVARTQPIHFPTTVGFNFKTANKRQGKRTQNVSPVNFEMRDIPSSTTKAKYPKSPSYRKVSFSNRQLSFRKQRSDVEERKTEIQLNQKEMLDNLNKLLGVDQKKRNFRISKNKLHQLLVKRYGQEMITGFFQLQALEDFDGMAKMLKEIVNASEKLTHLIAFFTLDLNQDGVITEDQLTKVGDLFSVEDSINSDIHRMVSYARNNPQLKCQPDFHANFLKHPTYKEYLKLNSLYKNEHADKIRGVMRFFTMKIDEDDQNDKKSLPVLNKNSQFLRKKKIRLNFEEFQKVFAGQTPNLMKDLIKYLAGNQEKAEIEEEEGLRVSAKRKPSGKTFSVKKGRSNYSMNQLSSGRTQKLQYQSKQKMVNAKSMLKTLKEEKKKLATIHYV